MWRRYSRDRASQSLPEISQKFEKNRKNTKADGHKDMYPTAPVYDTSVSLDYNCRTTAPCPKYFTCIVDQPRADMKFATFSALAPLTLVDLELTTPNVIISSERSFAYVIVPGNKYLLSDKIYRNEIGSTEVQLTNGGVTATAFAGLQISA